MFKNIIRSAPISTLSNCTSFSQIKTGVTITLKLVFFQKLTHFTQRGEDIEQQDVVPGAELGQPSHPLYRGHQETVLQGK
jgi:hypothetical protein